MITLNILDIFMYYYYYIKDSKIISLPTPLMLLFGIMFYISYVFIFSVMFNRNYEYSKMITLKYNTDVVYCFIILSGILCMNHIIYWYTIYFLVNTHPDLYSNYAIIINIFIIILEISYIRNYINNIIKYHNINTYHKDSIV